MRLKLREVMLATFSFNPRICKRCDKYSTFMVTPCFRFNPRICKRCDIRPNAQGQAPSVSIHASVKDATLCCIQYIFFQTVSIHASVKDATLSWDMFRYKSLVSIHASVKDATQIKRGYVSNFQFQSTHL